MSNLKTIILPKEIHSFYLPLPLIQQKPVYHKQNVGWVIERNETFSHTLNSSKQVLKCKHRFPWPESEMVDYNGRKLVNYNGRKQLGFSIDGMLYEWES